MAEAKQQSTKKKEVLRSLKFLIISISAGLVQIGSFAVLELIFPNNYWLAYLPSLLLSIIWNFTINRKVTFKSANNVKVAMLLVLAFYAVFTPLSTWLGDLAAKAGVNDFIVLAVTMIANFVLEYVYTRLVVYRGSCDTAVTTKPETEDKSALCVDEKVKN